MRPTERLMREHEVIAKGLAVLHELAARLERGEPVQPQSALRLLDFFAAFADAHHHIKEEDHLFPALIDAGLPAGHGPVGVMLQEHDVGRALLGRMRAAAAWIDQANPARGEFVLAANEYFALLGNHIHKENNILFRLADQVLPREEALRLEEEFERIEAEANANKQHAAHLRALEELARELLAAAA